MSISSTMHRFLSSTAAQYMTPTVCTVTSAVTMRELEKLFEKHDFNAFQFSTMAVWSESSQNSISSAPFSFTTHQMVPHFNALMDLTAADIMTEAMVHVAPEMPLTRVLQLMVDLKIRSFPVLDSGKRLIGMVSREDIMRALRETTDADSPAERRRADSSNPTGAPPI